MINMNQVREITLGGQSVIKIERSGVQIWPSDPYDDWSSYSEANYIASLYGIQMRGRITGSPKKVSYKITTNNIDQYTKTSSSTTSSSCTLGIGKWQTDLTAKPSTTMTGVVIDNTTGTTDWTDATLTGTASTTYTKLGVTLGKLTNFYKSGTNVNTNISITISDKTATFTLHDDTNDQDILVVEVKLYS